MNAAFAIRSLWTDLVVDPADARFADQPVSVPTPECPAGSVVRDNRWYFPQSVIAGLGAHQRVIDFNVPCGEGNLTDVPYAGFLQFCKLFAILKMARPLRNFADASTIKTYLNTTFWLVNAVANTSLPQGRPKLRDQTVEDLRRCITIISTKWEPNGASFDRLRKVLDQLRRYGEAKLLPDWFAQIGEAHIRELFAGGDAHRRPHDSRSDRSEKATPPLPALYCAKMLDVADFYFDVLAEPIIERVKVLARYRSDDTKALKGNPALRSDHPSCTSARYAAWALDHPWPVESLPFQTKFSFPANTTADFYHLLVSVQAAAMQTVALATGFRKSELLHMERDCLGSPGAMPAIGRITTMQFKNQPDMLSEPIARDAPDWVRKAVEFQLRLGIALGAPAVWHSCRYQDWGKRLIGHANNYLKTFARLHFLDPSFGGCDEIFLQRFRPTIAREIIVSPSGHILILQHVLGHLHIQTTEDYCKMNPHLATDQEQARLRRIGQRPIRPAGVEMQMQSLEGEIPADGIAELVRAAETNGQRLQLLAPGIVVSVAESDAAIVTKSFDLPFVRRAAFAFAISNLCRRDVRACRAAHDWYLAEGRRLLRAIDGDMAIQPANARQAAVLEIVRREA